METTAPATEPVTVTEGQLFRVLSNVGGTVLVEFRNGATGHVNSSELEDLTAGDVFALSDGALTRLDRGTWPAGDRTASVIWAGDDELIVKAAGVSFVHRQPKATPFIKGQTVRLGPDGQPVSVVADDPVDDLTTGHDDNFDPAALIIQPGVDAASLDDFGGNLSLVRRAYDLATIALSPDEPLQRMGVNPIKGILFSGPSGTGKTFLARGLASALDASFYNIGGPSIVDMFVGQTERRLRSIFEHANSNGPAILFFDEIDSLYTQRGDHNHEATNRLVGQFLALLDGFVPFERVLIIATTNLPDALDDALLRPGRLGHKLVFALPTVADRIQILHASSRKTVFSEPPDLSVLAAATDGWSAADLAAIWSEAGVAAAIDQRSSICWEDVLIGVESVDKDRNAHVKGN